MVHAGTRCEAESWLRCRQTMRSSLHVHVDSQRCGTLSPEWLRRPPTSSPSTVPRTQRPWCLFVSAPPSVRCSRCNRWRSPDSYRRGNPKADRHNHSRMKMIVTVTAPPGRHARELSCQLSVPNGCRVPAGSGAAVASVDNGGRAARWQRRRFQRSYRPRSFAFHFAAGRRLL